MVTPPQSVFSMKKISEADVKSQFSTHGAVSMASQVMTLYFVLCCNDQLQKLKEELGPKASTMNFTQGYSRDLVDAIPIKSIMSYVENRQTEYEAVYPELLCLVVEQFPQLFGVVNLLIEEEQNSRFFSLPFLV